MSKPFCSCRKRNWESCPTERAWQGASWFVETESAHVARLLLLKIVCGNATSSSSLMLPPSTRVQNTTFPATQRTSAVFFEYSQDLVHFNQRSIFSINDREQRSSNAVWSTALSTASESRDICQLSFLLELRVQRVARKEESSVSRVMWQSKLQGLISLAASGQRSARQAGGLRRPHAGL